MLHSSFISKWFTKANAKKKNAEGYNAPTHRSDAFDTLRHCPAWSAPSEFSEGVNPTKITINLGQFLETIPAPMIFWDSGQIIVSPSELLTWPRCILVRLKYW